MPIPADKTKLQMRAANETTFNGHARTRVRTRFKEVDKSLVSEWVAVEGDEVRISSIPIKVGQRNPTALIFLALSEKLGIVGARGALACQRLKSNGGVKTEQMNM